MDRASTIAVASEKRLLKLETTLGKGSALLTGFSGHEGISELFRFTLDFISPKLEIAPKEIIGTPVSWSVAAPTGTGRLFHGICRSVETGALMEDEQRAYQIEVVPSLWLLTQTVDCRIFQNLSALDIIRTVLEEHRALPGLEYDLAGVKAPGPTREYCVQYRESDFALISRLAEEEGIFYFFRHEKGRHVLVMADDGGAWFDLPDRQVEMTRTADDWGGITRWVESHTFLPASWVHRDFNFETPHADLTGTSNTRLPTLAGGPQEVFDYPGLYADRASGTGRAEMRMEEVEAGFRTVQGAGSHRHLAPGGRFSLAGHPAASGNGGVHVVHRVHHDAADHKLRSVGGGQPHYANAFTCFPADTVFRPARSTPRPLMRGPQTAFVVGPTGEEIDCDRHGRVRVQFHWDRLGGKDENSSCWIRVAQLSAGKGRGHQFVPRIGDEVVVDFLDGDPDRPLIVGSVYNGENTPPFPLPDARTQSGIRTRSTKGGGGADFNELRFEDRKGAEKVVLHAQKDLERTVENDETFRIGRDRTGEIERHLTETIRAGDRKVTIEAGNDTLSIRNGDRTTTLDLGKSLCEAMQSIELKVGQSSILIDQTGVTIKGMMIKIEGQAMTEVKAPMTQVKGDGMLIVKGGLVMIN